MLHQHICGSTCITHDSASYSARMSCKVAQLIVACANCCNVLLHDESQLGVCMACRSNAHRHTGAEACCCHARILSECAVTASFLVARSRAAVASQHAVTSDQLCTDIHMHQCMSCCVTCCLLAFLHALFPICTLVEPCVCLSVCLPHSSVAPSTASTASVHTVNTTLNRTCICILHRHDSATDRC